MTALLPYLLKVVLCSALLMAYYYLALRNKVFHQWNRFYLLATVILSLLIPCFSFTIAHTPEQVNSQVMQVLQVVTVSGPFEAPVVEAPDSFWKVYGVGIAYASVSTVLLVGLLLSLIGIYKLIKQHQVHQQGMLHLVFTAAKGSPFSFFTYLFWNPSIDMSSDGGQQIFKHELAHIEEKHSLDKLFMQLVLIVCWINPVFWLIRYELRMVHEFIADRKAVENQDASALAAMILQATYPQHYSQLTNAFFHQPIKRRLRMLTKIQNPRRNYISRLLLLPLMAVLTLAFTVRTEMTNTATYAKAVKQTVLSFIPIKEVSSPVKDTTLQLKDSAQQIIEPVPSEIRYTGKKVRVVIDAGHGGHDKGAGSSEVFEKDIALSVAKEVQALNSNANIEIIMTREGDDYVMLKDRANFSGKNEADLFISIHVGAAPPKKTEHGEIENPHRGFEVFIPRDSTISYFEQSKLLGSSLLHQLNTIATVPARMQLLQRNVGIWVLNQNTCPSILVECGYISNEKDRTFLLQKENQQQVARKILAGIESYLMAVDQKPLPVKSNVAPDYVRRATVDTIPPVVVKSGAKFTKAQLLAIPFAKLLQPDTEYTLQSAYFTIDQPVGGITEVVVRGTDMPKRVKQLLEEARSGNVITIDNRKALTKDGKEIKLPSLVYFVQ